MDEVRELIRGARKKFEIAEHLLYTTFPLVNDTKILITIAGNLYKSVFKGIDALIKYNYIYKKISKEPVDVMEKIEMFKNFADKYKFDRNFVVLAQDLKSLMAHKNNAPIEFKRGSNYVLADKNYKLRSVNYDKVKSFDLQVKAFVLEIERFFNNKGVFK